MKKLATLLLAAGMVVAASAPASAVDIKVNGQYTFDYQTGSTYDESNYSGAKQRVRIGIAAVASENLSGYFQIQNDEVWGAATNNNGDKSIQARLAYIDWTVPGTDVKVRMGRQELGLPVDAFGQNMVMHASQGSRDAIAFYAPVTDWLDLSAFWLRGYGNAEKTEHQAAITDDAFGIVAKIKGNGFTVEPWAVYAETEGREDYAALSKAKSATGNAGWNGVLVGDDYEYDGTTYWLGATATMTYFDPFKVVASIAWSEKKIAYEEKADRQGWYATAKASYKTAFGTPILAGWYATGDDKNDYKGQGRISSFGGRCRPVTVLAGAEAGIISDPNNTNNIAGTWGVQAGIEGVSFLKDLTHDFKVTYFEGTNDVEAVGAAEGGNWKFMTEEDSAVEIDFRSVYKIYKNLSATLDLSYIINDFDSTNGEGKKAVTDDAWRTALTFIYKF